VTNVRWKIVAMLVGFSVVSYIQRMNISVAAKFMIPELGLTQVQMGQIFSSFVLGYSILQIPMGALADRLGVHLLLAGMGWAWGLMTFLTGYLPGRFFGLGVGAFFTLVVVRFVLGLTVAGVYPLSARTVRLWQPISQRAFSYSWIVAGVFVGSSVTPPLAAWLVVSVGWRATFYLVSTLSVAMGIVWWFYGGDEPRKHPKVSETELAFIEGKGENVAAQASLSWGTFKRLIADRSVLMLILSYFLAGYVLNTFVYWFFIYLTDVRGFSVLEGGVYGSMPFIAAGILSPVGGALCDRATARLGARWGRRVTGLIGPLIAASFLLAGARTGNAFLALAALSLSFGFQEFAEGAYWSTTMDVGGRLTGTATGILNTANNLGGVVSTALMPVLVEHYDWVTALDSCSLVAALSALLWFAVRADRPLAAAR
jgi:ACS family glucarate transporter-like MFS transporter